MTKLLSLLFLSAIIIESTVFPFPLTFLLLLVVYPLLVEREEIWAFCLGMILDIFVPRYLGIDSLAFLISVFILRRYQQKLNLFQYISNFIVVIILVITYDWFFYRNMNPERFMLVAGITLVSFYFFRKIFSFPKKGYKLTL